MPFGIFTSIVSPSGPRRDTVVPWIEPRKEIVVVAVRSAPFVGRGRAYPASPKPPGPKPPVWPAAPPNIPLNRSDRSGPDCVVRGPPPPPNMPPKTSSKPPPPAPPGAENRAPPPIARIASYSWRSWGSLRTAYASEISLNFFSAASSPGFWSGWWVRASLR